jgi:hypothetical protein
MVYLHPIFFARHRLHTATTPILFLNIVCLTGIFFLFQVVPQLLLSDLRRHSQFPVAVEAMVDQIALPKPEVGSKLGLKFVVLKKAFKCVGPQNL